MIIIKVLIECRDGKCNIRDGLNWRRNKDGRSIKATAINGKCSLINRI